MAAPSREEVDPVINFPFKIGPTDKIVTAGSCFAQHIARYLSLSGFNHHIVERAHPILQGETAKKFNYELFSARYGNIYTSRQLRQLFERALNKFDPVEDLWQSGDRFIDPFRPTIQPDGFASEAELRLDRRSHLRRVRRAMRELDVFIFTLGLTEMWASSVDGAAFPVCPGVEGGQFDPEKHVFHNLSVREVVRDMTRAVRLLRRVNPSARVILTVSPVPLAATAENEHVLVSTTLSKSILRVAAAELVKALPNVAYFPSYEVITGSYTRGEYYANDLRNVTDAGVEHVMRLFFKHAAGIELPGKMSEAPAPKTNKYQRKMERVTDVLCEEALLDAD